MRKHGRKIKWPQCKDKRKTYQYRAVASYAKKCYEDLELDDKTVKVLTFNIVEYAKRKNLLSKGAQMLCMDVIVDICYDSISEIIEEESSLVSELRHCHRFVMDQINSKDNLVRLMAEPINEGGYPRLVMWYNQGHVTPHYLALNRKCARALSKIPQSDKEDLPDALELFKMCTFLVSPDMVDKLKGVLGKDLRIPPTLELTRS